MDIVGVLERFAELSQTERAWILTTLLDFRHQNIDKFNVEYGNYVNGLIRKLIEG